MRRLSRGLLLALALALCLTQLAGAEGSLLAQHMDRAYESGRQIEAVLSAELGGGLQLFMPEQMYTAVQLLLQDTRIAVHWAEAGDDMPAIGLSVGIKDVELISGAARVAADSIAVETSLLPGKTLIAPIDALGEMTQQAALPVQITDEMAAVFEAALQTYGAIAAGWAAESEGLYESGEIEGGATDARDGFVRSDHLRIGAEQLKDLLVRLATTFEGDGELHAALDSFLAASGGSDGSIADIVKGMSEGALGLVPLDGQLRLDAYTGADGNLVGLDISMDPMFEGLPQTAYARYDHMDRDGALAHDFQGRIGLAEGGQAAAKFSFSAERGAEVAETTDEMTLLGMFQPAGEEPINQITLTDKRHTALGEDREMMSDALALTIEQLTPGGAQDESSMPLTAAIETRSDTSGAGDDFGSDISVSVRALGMEFATLNLHLASSEHAPADTSGNARVDLASASPEEQAALMEELQAGLMAALMNSMQVLPPELLALMQGE